MTDSAEYLQAIFLKDYLNKTDVVNLLAGHRIKIEKGYGDGSKAFELLTGKQVIRSDKIIERWHSLKDIWESSEYGKTLAQLELDLKADDFPIPRNYVINWARERAIKPKVGTGIFEGFEQCLKYALEHEWVTPQDWEELEVGVGLAKFGGLLGEQKEENLLRLIGILKNMLSEERVIAELKKDPTAFRSQKDIVNYISGVYGEDHPNKGLQPTKLGEVMSAANKVLKNDGNP